VLAPTGTVAITCAAEAPLKASAATPLKVTADGELKAVPLMVTTVPGGPEFGLMPTTAGVWATTNALEETAVPAGVVTRTGPVLAAAGTVAVNRELDWTLTEVDATPLNETALTLMKFAPEIVTCAPAGPARGVKSEITGRVLTTKFPGLLADPFGVVTVTFAV
jgi:hypothetical protein